MACEDTLPLYVKIVLAIVAFLIIAYAVKFVSDMRLLKEADKPETMCGGYDQNCSCSGNESMVANDNNMSRILSGY